MRILFLSLFCLGLAACAGVKSASAPPPAYVVFFDGHTTALSPGAKGIVDHAAADAQASKTDMIQIAGPSARITPGYDPRYTQPRINAVIDELLAQGVTQNRIVQTSLTTDKIKVDSSGAQRIEIRIVKPNR